MFNKSMIENTKLNCKISVLTVFIGTSTLCKGTIKSLADSHVMLKILQLDLNHLDSWNLIEIYYFYDFFSNFIMFCRKLLHQILVMY